LTEEADSADVCNECDLHPEHTCQQAPEARFSPPLDYAQGT